MASGVYNTFKYRNLTKAVDVDTGGDTLKVQLHTSNYTPDADHVTTANLTAEVVGSGYSVGGATLTNQAVTQDNTNDRAYLDADDVTWASSSITARYAVVVDTTVSNSLVCWIDFASNKVSSSGDFKIQWAAGGILRLA